MNTRAASLFEDLVAHQVMSSPAIACREEATLEEVAELLADREISGVAVLGRSGEVTGVISERDVAHALGGPLLRLAIRRPVHTGPFLRAPLEGLAGAKRAHDVMSSPPITAHPETPLRALAEVMVKERVNRILIVRGNRLVGVVTRTDVLSAIAGIERRHADIEARPIVFGSVWGEVEPTGFEFDRNPTHQ